jgi:hypothetical protein
MAQEHIEDLRKARTALVNVRRNWAKVLAGTYERGKSDQAIKDIVDVQRAIDVVDQAIIDEGDLFTKGQ